MAPDLSDSIGLTIPGRPSSPCRGRPQHYNRPGNPIRQATRTFSNGTTITFGSDDIVQAIEASDPFYIQAQAVEVAISDIVAMRQQHQDGRFSTVSWAGGPIRGIGQHGNGSFASSSLSNAFAATSISGVPESGPGHKKAFKGDNHFLDDDKHRNFGRVSRRRARHEQHSNQNRRVFNNNGHKETNNFRHSIPSCKMSHSLSGASAPAQRLGDKNINRSQVLGGPSIQTGSYYNSFGASILGPVDQHALRGGSQGLDMSLMQPIYQHSLPGATQDFNSHTMLPNNQYALHGAPQNLNTNNTLPNHQHALHGAVQNFNMPTMQLGQFEHGPFAQQANTSHRDVTLSGDQISRSGFPLRYQNNGSRSAHDQQQAIAINHNFAQSGGYVTHMEFPFSSETAQFGSRCHAQQQVVNQIHNLAPPDGQLSRSGIPLQSQSNGWNASIQYDPCLIAVGPTLPTIPIPGPATSANHHAADCKFFPELNTSSVTAQNPALHAQIGLDSNYYGSSVINMSLEHMDSILLANGIRLPAIYEPPPGYYNGPLYDFNPEVAQEIMRSVESSQHPAFPSYRSRGRLAQMTMLMPYGLPPEHGANGPSQAAIHRAECRRHTELMQEVLAVPGKQEHGEEPWTWYRMLNVPRYRREPVTWHPNVIDLYGVESQYEALLTRDLNHLNNNEKGVGRINAPPQGQVHGNATMRNIRASQKRISQATDIRISHEYHTPPIMQHARQESEETSVFYRGLRTPLTSCTGHQYVGYKMRVKRTPDPALDTSPTPPSRRHSAECLVDRKSQRLNPSLSVDHEKKRAFSATKTPLNLVGQSSNKDEQLNSSASKTPLLDFDKEYTAKHGEGDEVDFAARDVGPPRIDGMTFNELIGFTPTSGMHLGGDAPFGYPDNIPRQNRD